MRLLLDTQIFLFYLADSGKLSKKVRSDIARADEVFISGTGAEVMAVGSVDQRKVGSGSAGEITARIQDVYFKSVRGEHSAYKKWLTPVWNV